MSVFYSLLVIAEVTLYFFESQVELAVGLTLTIMLVMYTMYQSIDDMSTKTAYLKMIDFWLLFCLLIPFTIFMIEIFWLLKRTKKDLKTKNNLAEEKNEQKWPNKIIIQILVPSLTVLFIMIYFGSAVVFSSL
jgi:high-affinity K+ transport system ATPase subunit B